MKNLARSFVWWPKIDADLEQQVRHCAICQQNRNLPATAPLMPWEWPDRSWARIHIDYAGPVLGHMFLVIVDAYSKWLEVKAVKSATSSSTISQLMSVFTTHGVPEQLVSDNGTAFTSTEFKTFLQQNGIRHTTSAPYHPATNGLAERAVQTLKQFLKKSTRGLLENNISKFLFRYRITPHSTIGVSPSELLYGRSIQSNLDLMIPSVCSTVQTKQDKQKQTHDKSSHSRSFTVDDEVYIRDFPENRKWIPGTIEKVCGPLTYLIKLSDGCSVRRHIDHIHT